MKQLIQTLWKMRGGVHPEFNKAASAQSPIKTMPIPPQLIVPLQQHIGDSSILKVSVGDKVLKGQALTAMGAFGLGAIVHAPSSGAICDISAHALPHPSGMSGMCIFIDTDGLDKCFVDDAEEDSKSSISATGAHFETLDYLQLSTAEILHRIERAGVVGLGGATFPSAVKLAAEQSIDTLIINAAECEPFISCDDALMRERSHQVVIGIKILIHLLKPKHCLIGIEDNKPEAIDALQTALFGDSVESCQIVLKVVPTQYPSGDSRQLTQLLTGIEISKKQHSLASGVLCHNIATAYAIYRAVMFDEPLLSRIVTIAGDGVVEQCNVEILIGTPISYIIEQLGGYTDKAERLIMGGPMMGFALPTDELPIIKASNCILASSIAALALSKAAAGTDDANSTEAQAEKQVMPCIRCNKCADVCPVNLLPQQLYWHSRAHDFEKASEHKLSDCIECGACNYVCPSYIPLVDYFRFAKTEIKSQQLASIKSSRSRERFEFNELRKQRIKAERDSKRKQHKEAFAKKKAQEAVKSAEGSSRNSEKLAVDIEKSTKQDAIKAAMARAKAKKEAMAAAKKDSNRDNNSNAV